ncbi:MAG: hypothetical protein ACR2OO_16645 [Thermomicrobiales bacterium]
MADRQHLSQPDAVPTGIEDEVDQESLESFPASDPPTYSRVTPPDRPYSGEPPPADDPAVQPHDPSAPLHDGR